MLRQAGGQQCPTLTGSSSFFAFNPLVRDSMWRFRAYRAKVDSETASAVATVTALTLWPSDRVGDLDADCGKFGPGST
jgi:hypothetical protein